MLSIRITLTNLAHVNIQLALSGEPGASGEARKAALGAVAILPRNATVARAKAFGLAGDACFVEENWVEARAHHASALACPGRGGKRTTSFERRPGLRGHGANREEESAR